MKRWLSLTCLASSAFIASAQTIFIANNNPGAVAGVNVFTGANAVGDAIAAASDGDIIYVVPSGTTYAATGVSKSLTIFGSGFNPDKAYSATSKLVNITVSANNVRLSGLVSPFVQVSNGVMATLVDKCRINRIVLTNASNTIIVNCVLGENTSGQFSIANFDLTNSGVRVTNNIIYGSSSSGFLNNLNNATIENNVFVGITGFPAYDAFNIVQNSNIKNNIFFGVQPRGTNTANFISNTQQFNLTYGATNNDFVSGINGNTASNNVIGSDPMFINLPLASAGNYYTLSYDAQLNELSPAKGVGEGGIDIGAFGGPTPFDLFGTSLPVVQTVIAPATVPQGTDMSVRVKGKGN